MGKSILTSCASANEQYLCIFLGADVISLIMQAVGGGIASSADATKGDDMEIGPNIMLAGIVFQLISMLFFVVIGTDFVYRVMADKPYAFRLTSSRTNSLGSSTSNAGESCPMVDLSHWRSRYFESSNHNSRNLSNCRIGSGVGWIDYAHSELSELFGWCAYGRCRWGVQLYQSDSFVGKASWLEGDPLEWGDCSVDLRTV
jgi:hypothetical protein